MTAATDTPTLPFTSTGPTRHGLMCWPANDLYVGRSLELYGEYGPNEAALFSSLIRPGMTVLDCGANIGSLTVHFARLSYPGIVYAFEPVPFSYYYLCANIVLGNHKNIRPFRYVLGTCASTVKVPVYDPGCRGNYGGVPVDCHGFREGEPCDMATLDHLARWCEFGHVDFIKVDVEGMERDVLWGASKLIRDCRPVLYVECDRPDKSDALIDYIRSIGYTTYLHLPFLYTPDNYRANPHNVFPDCVSINLLCFPDSQGDSLGLQEVHRIEYPSNFGTKFHATP